jgi:hypothetical protein
LPKGREPYDPPYSEENANIVGLVQGPWSQAGQEHHRREIRYEIQNSKRQFEVADYQVIDVMNDHLCYVITERKTAWFLPWSNYFTVVLKIVITHVAKSQSKLAIYSRNDWSTVPVIGRSRGFNEYGIIADSPQISSRTKLVPIRNRTPIRWQTS